MSRVSRRKVGRSQSVNPLAQANAFPPQPPVGGQQIHAVSSQFYQGPIPHPDILDRFEQIVPGSAGSIVGQALEEGNHRRALEVSAQEANIESQKRQLAIAEYQSRAVFRSDTISQILGATVSLGCIASAVYLAIHGHETIAGAIAIVPTGALIQAFFVKRTK